MTESRGFDGEAHDQAKVLAAVRAFDLDRANHDLDASVGVVVHADLQVEATGPVRALARLSTSGELPTLDGATPIEARALAAKAAVVLAPFQPKRLVRVSQWPAGFVVDGETIYVSASWLAAMGGDGVNGPSVGPAAVGANPADPTMGTDPPGYTGTPYTFCSVAGEDAARSRRLFWIVGPFAMVLFVGQAWKRRARRQAPGAKP